MAVWRADEGGRGLRATQGRRHKMLMSNGAAGPPMGSTARGCLWLASCRQT